MPYKGRTPPQVMRRIFAAKSKRCPRCMGRGVYPNFRNETVECGVCGGTGKVAPVK